MSKGNVWICFVMVLLAVPVAANIALLRVAGADPSVAVEPDYHRKAEHWDERRAAEVRSARLGWTIDARPELRASALPVSVRLAGASGAPVSGAEVSVEAFAIARSGDRMLASATTDDAGLATLALPRGRAGRWELRFEARRGEDVFVATQRVDVAPASAP